MAKSNFLLSDEWKSMFTALPDEKAGQLIKAAFMYHAGEDVQIDDPVLDAVFCMVKAKMDSDNSRVGASHWNWKGGITENHHAIRESSDYKMFRRAVLKRDSYTCQNCGKHGGKLNVHHIKRFADYPELRMSLDNGVTLCVDCHRKAHKNER